VNDSFTVEEAIFAEKGDMTFLGGRMLEGLALSVVSRKRKLTSSGPLPAA
jgi:hypothetical protein